MSTNSGPRQRGKLYNFPGVPYSTKDIVYYWQQSPVSTYGSGNALIGMLEGRVMNDVVTPNFRARIAQGEIINNPMSLTESRVEIGSTWSGQVFRGKINNTSGLAPGTLYDHTLDYTNYLVAPSLNTFRSLQDTLTAYDKNNVSQQAVNEAFAKAHQRDMMSIVDIAEFHKTAAMINQLAGRLVPQLFGAPVYDKLVKRTFSQRNIPKKKSLKDFLMSPREREFVSSLPDVWLEVNYGWLPTLLSLQGLVKALGEQRKNLRQTFRGFEDESEVNEAVYTNVGTQAPLGTAYTDVSSYKVSKKLNVRAAVMTDYQPDLLNRLGLTARDLPGAGFELVRLSFVLGWVLDLGTAIEAFLPVEGFRVLASSVTVSEEIELIYSWQRTGNTLQDGTSTYTYGSGTCACAIYDRLKTRTPGVTPGLPSWNFRFRSTFHLLSGAALALSSVGGRRNARL